MNEKNNTVKNPTQKRFRKKQNKSEIPLAQASKELDRVKSQRASGSVKKTLQPRNETPQRKPQNTQPKTSKTCGETEMKEPVRRTPVKIIPLGGLNEIGKNFTVIECSNDMFVIDCGLAFLTVKCLELISLSLISHTLRKIRKSSGALCLHMVMRII